MDSTGTDLKKTSHIEQMALIGKMHNMQWLKSNSQLSGHTKTLADGKDIISNTQRTKINEGTKGEAEIDLTNTISESTEIENNDPTLSKDSSEKQNIINNNSLQLSAKIIESSEKNMETVWNKDVNISNTLFPHSQSLLVQRLHKPDTIGMSLAENIVNVQVEQLRLSKDEEDKSDALHNEADTNWGNIDHNISESAQKSDSDVNNQVARKQSHDNNNNNAKSKSQSPLETKKNIQKVPIKISTNKLGDSKVKKQGGASIRESYTTLKQGSKSQDELLNLCNDNDITSTSMDEKKMTVGTTPKFVDKCGKVNGYNKNFVTGKGGRLKEQQLFKQNFSMLNDSANRNRSSIEALDEKGKLITAKSKLNRSESEKKRIEVDDSKRCHKIQMTRTQSYNVQYNRNKQLMKQQQRYTRSVTKQDEDCSTSNSSTFNNTINTFTLAENATKKKSENQQPATNKCNSDAHLNQNISEKTMKSSDVSEYSMGEKSSVKPNSIPCKRNYQNLPNVKNSIDRSVKDDQAYAQRFKKDSNIYRRSSGILHKCIKEVNDKTKPEDAKRNIADTNLTKDYRVSRINSIETKVRSPSEGSRVTVYQSKTSNGASNISKTDTLDSTSVNNVQSVKSLHSCPISTKDSTEISTSAHTSQESQVLQASCNETEVQFLKTEQEDTSNNNSNNKTSINSLEAKSVKFSESIQEFNTAHHSMTSYSDNSVNQAKLPANAYYSDVQTASNSNTQQVENYHTVQNKSYFENSNAQYNTITNSQNTDRDFHLLDSMQQKPEQTPYMSPQNVLPQHNCNPNISMGNGMPYQNMPTVYLNQYNNAQTALRKTADSAGISQNPLIPSTSSYTVDNQNIVQSDPLNILMHNTQPSVLPPPGFHSHPITTQHNQWSMPVPEMFVFGNVMNPTHSLNMPIQNSRHICNAEFNSVQQPGYLQQPLFYVPPLCMQGWNPLLQYPAPVFQNPSYNSCNAYPNQVLPANSLTESINCQAPTSIQSNPYKHYHQMQTLENPPNFSVPVKLDNYMGNMQGCKTGNVRMKETTMDGHMRANQYRAPVPNEYQNCSQDAPLMLPFPYAVTMDSLAKNGPPTMQMQQKYAPRALTTANYQRMSNTCSVFHSNPDGNNRKDDVSKNDSECLPPMVSPRECMYYGVNYPRKTDNVHSSSARQDVKPVPYMQPVNSENYIPQYQKNVTYHPPPHELSSRTALGQGLHKRMEH